MRIRWVNLGNHTTMTDSNRKLLAKTYQNPHPLTPVRVKWVIEKRRANIINNPGS